jgi:hypothetical protein
VHEYKLPQQLNHCNKILQVVGLFESFEKCSFFVIHTPDKGIRGQAPVGTQKILKTLDFRFHGNDH